MSNGILTVYFCSASHGRQIEKTNKCPHFEGEVKEAEKQGHDLKNLLGLEKLEHVSSEEGSNAGRKIIKVRDTQNELQL